MPVTQSWIYLTKVKSRVAFLHVRSPQRKLRREMEKKDGRKSPRIRRRFCKRIRNNTVEQKKNIVPRKSSCIAKTVLIHDFFVSSALIRYIAQYKRANDIYACILRVRIKLSLYVLNYINFFTSLHNSK